MNASKECDADDEDIDDNVSDNIADDNDDNNYDDGDDQVWVHDHWGGHEDMWRGSVSIFPHCHRQSNDLHNIVYPPFHDDHDDSDYNLKAVDRQRSRVQRD